MNPRALLLWSAAALVVDLATNDPLYRALVVLATVDVLAALAPRGRRLRPTLAAAALFGGLAIGLNALLSHTGVHVIAALPDAWPLVGGPLTVESVGYGIGAALGIVGAVLAVAPISLVLEPHELIDALPARFERSGLAVAIALNLVPGIGRNAIAIRDAERMRGWRPRGPRSWADILVPTMLSAIEDALTLAEAMEARAYGTVVRTRFATVGWRRRDALAVAGAWLAAGLFIVGRLRGWTLDWEPYPALTLPPVDTVLVAACLLLVLPGLPWPSSASSV